MKQCLCEKCWKGYVKRGMKTLFGKKYPNCVKKSKAGKRRESVKEAERKMSSLEMQQIILLAKAMKQMPGSPAQKKIKQQINVIRKKLGQKPVKESLLEKMGPKELHAYMQHVFDTQFKTADEKKMKKTLIKKMNIAQKKKGLPIFKESVNEVSGVDVAKKVLKNKQMEKGLDLQTANLIVTIDKAYNKNPRLQKKFRAIKLPKMKQLILKFGR
jgi:hypothetical protein|tara:strand:- start:103 stop:744 length:642 start_codon:yes stop_codon:yes gene_type:complete